MQIKIVKKAKKDVFFLNFHAYFYFISYKYITKA